MDHDKLQKEITKENLNWTLTLGFGFVLGFVACMLIEGVV